MIMGIEFQIAPLPVLRFAAGAVSEVGARSLEWGRRALLVSGANSFDQLNGRFQILDNLSSAGVEPVAQVRISGEPSPQRVDEIVAEFSSQQVEVVIAIGGGSVLDAAKCLSGLLPSGDSVMEYLEGVGNGKQHDGRVVPMVAVPTTAGTGSEASMNGVLADRAQGFKRSFRHPSLVPRLAIVDPDLLATSPQALIAANGCDALSQLLESYLSTKASPFTDGLALSAIERMGQGLIPLWQSQGEDADARSAVAYGSMVSGLTLANAGLGAVHGIAGPIGGLFPVPHGVACGTLLGEANRINIEALQMRAPGSEGLQKYGMIGEKLGFYPPETPRSERMDLLVSGLMGWVEKMKIPRLGTFGIGMADVPKILSLSDQKANPVTLTESEFREIVENRI